MPSTPLNRCAIVNLAIHGTSARQKSDEPSSIGQAANRHVVNEEALSRLLTVDIGELRQQWRGLYKTQAPRHLSRELLVRAVAFRMQELARAASAQSRSVSSAGLHSSSRIPEMLQSGR
jgi:hypothetical protein